MKDWEDREQLVCVSCGHKWILISNKMITQEQHNIWIKVAMEHHRLIKEEKEENK